MNTVAVNTIAMIIKWSYKYTAVLVLLTMNSFYSLNISSIVYDVNKTVFFFYKYYKHLKCKIETPKSIKNKFYPHMIHLKKD